MEYFWGYLELKSYRGYSINDIPRETTYLVSNSPKHFLKFTENNQCYQYETFFRTFPIILFERFYCKAIFNLTSTFFGN